MTSIGGRDLSAWFEDLPRAPKLGRSLRRTGMAVAKIAGLIGLTGLGLALAVALVPAQVAAPRVVETADAWVEVNRPIEIFGLAGTDFARLPHSYRARRHAADGSREDFVGFGDVHADAPFLALAFYRVGRTPPTDRSFADDIDAMARDRGLGSVRAAAPAVISTRFGPFEAADVRLADGGSQTPCLGFRTQPGKGRPLHIAGLLCGGGGRPAARDSLGCVIDRIDLLSAGDDTALQRMFVEAERRRGQACTPSSLTSAGSRITWLDANASLPVLRGLSADRASKE